MIDLLKNQLVAYINSKKKHLVAFDGLKINIKSELISDALFDIKDLMPTKSATL